ncbi:hypothetical protein F4805DRAFT_479046 [Annulohypoxylon moriforme]|nr:hypothetical protein F4805DRAFT_479046 [Annulohypoxylon moriforme]
MQYPALIVAAILAMGTDAAAVKRDNPNLVQFSGFRESQCNGNASTGEYIVLESQLDTCNQFAPPAAGVGQVRSVNVEFFKNSDCTLTVYYDILCTGDGEDISRESCVTVNDGADYFISYKVTC